MKTEMKKMALRKANDADAATVLALYRACAQLKNNCWSDDYPDAEIVAEDIRNGWLYVWEEEGTVQGTAALLDWDDIEDMQLDFIYTQKPCVLCRLALWPDRQGRGEGRALLLAAEQQAHKLGYGAMHLLCDIENAPACALYTRGGYRYISNVALYEHEFGVYERRL